MKNWKKHLIVYIIVILFLFIYGGITDSNYNEINLPWLLGTLWFLFYPIVFFITIVVKKVLNRSKGNTNSDQFK